MIVKYIKHNEFRPKNVRDVNGHRAVFASNQVNRSTNLENQDHFPSTVYSKNKFHYL